MARISLFGYFSGIISLFYLQILDELDLEVLEFEVLLELAILELFSTWRYKEGRIPCICMH